MSFDWSDYLTLAEELAGQAAHTELEEAHYRTSISRAYYASFHRAVILLRTQYGYRPPNVDAHGAVIRELDRPGNPREERRIGQELRRLRDQRNRADYEDSFAPMSVSNQARLALARARQIANEADAL